MPDNMMTINQMYRMLNVWTHRIRHSDRFIERYSGAQRALLAYLSLDLLMEDDGFVLLIADGRGEHALAPETAEYLRQWGVRDIPDIIDRARILYQQHGEAIQAAARNGVGVLVLVSAAQANTDSRFFYMRMKGQLENAVRALPFAKTVILRPPMLVRDHSDRPSEILTVKLLRGLNAIGLFRSQKPMPTDTLARVMCHAAAEFPEGVHILEAADI